MAEVKRKSNRSLLIDASYKERLLIYLFFLIHMLAFGASGFYMAYGDDVPELSFLYMHGGLAVFVYMVFYLALFGLDEVKWIFINAILGFYGILSEIDNILSIFEKHVSDFPWYVHAIPFLYYILYTFLIRQFVIDVVDARHVKKRRTMVELTYVLFFLGLYSYFYLV